MVMVVRIRSTVGNAGSVAVAIGIGDLAIGVAVEFDSHF